MKIEIEATEETVDITNKLLIHYLKNNTELSDEQSNQVEQFRRKMILPFATNSKTPIATAFSKFFGQDLIQIDTVKSDTEQ